MGGATRITVNGAFGALHLRAIWAGRGWPADVRAVLAGIPSERDWPRDLVVAAQRLSPGALELLEARDANWIDETGAARIVGPGVLVLRDAHGEPHDERGRPFSWSPSALAVAEGLLAKSWADGIGTTELATLVQWSPPQVSQVLQAFDEEGWTAKYGPQRGRGARRELIGAEQLLERWTAAIVGGDREERQAHRIMRDPLAFLDEELAAALDGEVRWALSGWAAAHELAPMADAVPSLQIYVHEDDFERPLDRSIAKAGLSNVAEGGRIAFFPAPGSVLALAGQTPTGPLVSPPRVYADLQVLGGRGEDAAEHLKAEVLERLHPSPHRGNPPGGLLLWDEATRDRLEQLAEERNLSWPYSRGTWSASYRLTGTSAPPSLNKLMGVLREVAGRESGWPPWWIPEHGESRPRPVGEMIECWFSDLAESDPANADFWRAARDGRLSLIRTYQEDWEFVGISPGQKLDIVLPIVRCGECLRHAERVADRLEASGVQFMMRWTGLEGRTLSSLADRRRRLSPTWTSTTDEVVCYTEVRPEQIERELPTVVGQMLEPLYASFDFFEPPTEIYEEELGKLVDLSGGDL